MPYDALPVVTYRPYLAPFSRNSA